MKEDLHKRMLTGYEKFSNDTSLHGFSELYNAKTKLWKFVWFVISVGACIITVYQVNNTVQQYLTETTHTVIVAADEESILYPPLQLCYWQWMYWVDWKKALSLGFTDDTLLYSFRFFNSIYTTRIFNMSSTEKKFSETMINNGFTTFSQLFYAIARSIPLQGDNGIEMYFNKTLFTFRDPYLLFCYEMTSENMKTYFSKSAQKQKTISFNVYGQTFEEISQFINIAEYNGYMFRWADKSSMYVVKDKSKVNLTNFAPPVVLYLLNNMAKGLDLQMDEDAYYVDLRASVYTWQSKSGKSCDLNKCEIFGANSSCLQNCNALFGRLACSCQRFDSAILLRDDTPITVCHKDFIFISSASEDQYLVQNQTAYTDRSPVVCSYNGNNTRFYNDCLSQCLPACQIWHYEQSVTVKQMSAAMKKLGKKNATKVVIEYPKGKDIIVMDVKDAQNWETFIGNVGGLLGIWTGASVMSFIEIVYLCFFADHEENCHHFLICGAKKKGKTFTKSTVKIQQLTVFTVRPAAAAAAATEHNPNET